MHSSKSMTRRLKTPEELILCLDPNRDNDTVFHLEVRAGRSNFLSLGDKNISFHLLLGFSTA